MSEGIESASAASRALMRGTAAGVLATQSVAAPGYPLGSLVPFVLTPEGRVIVYVSRIAQHTKNFEQDPRASLTVVEADLSGADGDPQAFGRVSVLGDARRLEGAERDAAEARYAIFFPDSRGHSGVHDFDYWAIDPVRVRFIGGFGAIHWVERDDFCQSRVEWQDGEAGIVAHMNDDHRDAMALIWVRARGTEPRERSGDDDAQPRMLAGDPEGFHMRWGNEVAYVPYGKRCESAMDVRKEMVRLTNEAREAGV
ncbi:MAG: HugZ family protein [Myxococcota bacterium]